MFERTDTASVFESETLSERARRKQQIALADTSTNATFNSAFDEAASGGSSFSDALRYLELGRKLSGGCRRRRELRFQWRFEFVDAGPERRGRERRPDDGFGGGEPG